MSGRGFGLGRQLFGISEDLDKSGRLSRRKE